MKNLNKKIGAVALASMVVFGGVAASGVGSFAAAKESVSVSQENKDKAWLDLQAACRGFDYRVAKEYANEKEARAALKDIKQKEPKRKIYPGIRKLPHNPKKALSRLWHVNFERVVVKFEGKYFLIKLDYRLD